jgi:hypothetical protein
MSVACARSRTPRFLFCNVTIASKAAVAGFARDVAVVVGKKHTVNARATVIMSARSVFGATGSPGPGVTGPIHTNGATSSSVAAAITTAVAAEEAAVQGPPSLLSTSWGGVGLVAAGVVFIIAGAATARRKAGPGLLIVGVLLGIAGGAWIIVNDVKRTKAANQLNDAWQVATAAALRDATIARQRAEQAREQRSDAALASWSSIANNIQSAVPASASVRHQSGASSVASLARVSDHEEGGGRDASTHARTGHGASAKALPASVLRTRKSHAESAANGRRLRDSRKRRRLSWRDESAPSSRGSTTSRAAHGAGAGQERNAPGTIATVREFDLRESPLRVRHGTTVDEPDAPPRPLVPRKVSAVYGDIYQEPRDQEVTVQPVVSFVPYAASTMPRDIVQGAAEDIADLSLRAAGGFGVISNVGAGAVEAVVAAGQAAAAAAPPGTVCGPMYYSPPASYPDVNDMADERQRFWSRPDTPTLDHHRRVQGLREAALSLGPSRDGRAVLVVPD